MIVPLAAAGPSEAPLQLLVAAPWATLYAVRARRLRARGRPVPAWRQWCFWCGLVVIVATVSSPLGILSDEIFYPHMVEHLLLMDVGAALLVAGLTGPLLAPLLRLRWAGALRRLAHPAVALPLWAANLYLWHVPFFQQVAVRHDVVHALQHTCFIGFAMAMWMPLLGPFPMPAWFGNGARLGYVLVVRLAGTALANVLLWAPPLYSVYAAGERRYGLGAARDQMIGGGIMMVEGSLLTLVLFGWLFLRAMRHAEERDALLDLAAARGVTLTAERAARAVAAGQGPALRRRLTGAPAARRG